MKTVLILFLLHANLSAQVVLSEVLANEPEGRVRLEWVEIYNDAPASIDLQCLVLVAGNDTSYFPEGSTVPAHSYTILARQLVPDDGSDSFEGHWGDSSGVWGDSYQERYPAFEVNVSLSNSSGFLALVNNLGREIDRFAWSSPSPDGHSTERDDVSAPVSGWHDCSDPGGSTPGRPNSPVAPAQPQVFSVSIEPRLITRNGDGPDDQFRISYSIPSGTELDADIFDDTGYHLKTILRKSIAPMGSVLWNGCNNDGARLLPGIYIVLLTLSGQRSETRSIPVVIAP